MRALVCARACACAHVLLYACACHIWGGKGGEDNLTIRNRAVDSDLLRIRTHISNTNTTRLVHAHEHRHALRRYYASPAHCPAHCSTYRPAHPPAHLCHLCLHLRVLTSPPAIPPTTNIASTALCDLQKGGMGTCHPCVWEQPGWMLVA